MHSTILSGLEKFQIQIIYQNIRSEINKRGHKLPTTLTAIYNKLCSKWIKHVLLLLVTRYTLFSINSQISSPLRYIVRFIG